MTFLRQGIPQNLVKKCIILGHIDQVQFVSTEFNSPFPTNSCGGYSERLRKRLINACPLDRPLIWLVNCAYFFGEVVRSAFSRDFYVCRNTNRTSKRKRWKLGYFGIKHMVVTYRILKKMKLIYLEVKRNCSRSFKEQKWAKKKDISTETILNVIKT